MSFVPLRVRSQFSILNSTLPVQSIASLAQKHQISAVALTDRGNMFGVVDFYKACKSANVKPIIGCELDLAYSSRFEKKRIGGTPVSFPIILLAKDKQGYKNLCRLTSLGYLEGFYYRPRIDKELLQKYSQGLICLSGSVMSNLSHLILNGSYDEVLQEVEWFLEIFKDDYYFELQRHQMAEDNIISDKLKSESWVFQEYIEYIKKQKTVEENLLSLAKKLNVNCVATNDTLYSEREDWKAHEILLNVQSGEPCEIWERDSRGEKKLKIPNPKRKIYSSHEFYFKSSEEMQQLFIDIPEAIDNTLTIAEKCHYEFDFDKKHYPTYTPPGTSIEEKNPDIAKEYLKNLCLGALEQRYPPSQLARVKEKYPDQDPMDVVKKRFSIEFDVLASKGMCDYMLIVYDFIDWAKKQNIPVGPGRGSAAGSIIAYLMGITDIEPLQFNLFFERFINPERISYPDIDVDICMERRSEVIDYTIQKYGKDKVAQIITFGTMKAKMAIRDVGRVLSVDLAKVNAIAKLIPEDLSMTIEKALQIDPELKFKYDNDPESKTVIDMALKLEGSIRNTSTHAAGIIISADSIMDHVPVCTAKDSEMVVTQFSMKPVEAVGMLKIDFLGLKTLTSIQKSVEFIEKNFQTKVEWETIPLDDKNTYNLLNCGKTLGVFQLESGGMQELSKQLHIDHFEEIIAVGALYRPGPMDMIPSFIARKHKREEIDIDHPKMKDILEETYGVMVYQEQVMQIASVLAGYSLGEGDVLRRAMGKKDKKEMDRQREKFVEGAFQKGVEKHISATIFDKIEKFASYGFNKSHATAYAYLSYVTAYMKANYTHEWMASLLTCDRDDISKVAKFIGECRSLNIDIMPPDVNEAGMEFMPTKKGIRFAMKGIKGVGEAVVEAIINEREKNGVFSSLYDFIQRVDTSRVGKKVIELLVDAGAFDFTNWERDALRMSVEPMYEEASRAQKESAKGVLTFFSLLGDTHKKEFLEPPKVLHPSTRLEMLQREKELLGFYLTSHPMESYKDILKGLSCVPIKDITTLDDGAVCRAAFILDKVKCKIASKSQRKFAILTISDGLERFELPVWPDLYEKNVSLLEENRLIYAIIQVEKKDEKLSLQCRWLDDLTQADEKMIKKCDTAYDEAKKIVSFRKKSAYAKKEKTPVMKKQEEKILIHLDADKLRLSEILQLKEIFHKNPGVLEIEVSFFSGKKKVGTIAVDSANKLQFSDEVKKQISNIPSMVSLHTI